MSLPKFPKPDSILSREQALDAILTSIAMEEVALSHIINAEGEKIQHVLQSAQENNADIRDILKVNESVALMIEQVNDMQIILKNKLRLALKYLPKPEEDTCQKPKPPRPKPKPCSCQDPRPPHPMPRPCSCRDPRPPRPVPTPCSCQNPRPPWSMTKPCSCQRSKPCSRHLQNDDFFNDFDQHHARNYDFRNNPYNKKF